MKRSVMVPLALVAVALSFTVLSIRQLGEENPPVPAGARVVPQAAGTEGESPDRRGRPNEPAHGGAEQVERRTVEEGQAALRVKIVTESDDGLGSIEAMALPLTEPVLQSIHNHGPIAMQGSRSLKAAAEEEGLFYLESWEPPLLVVAKADGHAPNGMLIEALDGGARTLELHRGYEVSGRVIGFYQDDPLLDVTVTASPDVSVEMAEGRDPLDPAFVAARVFGWSTRVRPGGEFLLRGVSEGRISLRARGRSRTSETVSIVVDGAASIDLYLRKGRSIVGTVVESGSGAPIPGARLALLEVLNAVQAREKSVAFSDEKGAFVLDGLPWWIARSLKVRIEATGYASKLAVIPEGIVEAGGPFHIELSPACRAYGWVQRKDGKPLGDRVWVSLQEPGGGLIGWTRVGENGEFELGCAEPGKKYDLVVSADTYNTVRREAVDVCASSPLSIEVDPYPVLKGRLVAEEYPLKGVRLVARIEDGYGNPILEKSLAVNPDTGTFETRELGPGDYILEGVAKGWAPFRAGPYELKEKETVTVEVDLRRGRRVSGRVVSSRDGSPIPGARIVLKRRSVGPLVNVWAVEEMSDGEGMFQLSGVPFDSGLWIAVEAEGFGQALVPVPDGTADVDLGVVEVEPGCTLRVCVVDMEGRTLPCRQVGGLIRDSVADRWVFQESEGCYSLNGARTGTWVIDALPHDPRSWGSVGTFVRRIVEVGNETEMSIEMKLGGSAVAGELRRGGRVYRGWYYVAVQPVGGDTEYYSHSTGDGTFLVSGTPQGPAVVTVEMVGELAGMTVRREVEVPAAGRVWVVFDVEGIGLRGRVVDGEGRDVGGARVVAEFGGGDEGAGETRGVVGMTRADGSFAIEGLQPGRYVLRFSKAGYGEVSRIVELSDASVEGKSEIDIGSVVLHREGVIWVEVRDSTGAPLPAEVWAEGEGDVASRSVGVRVGGKAAGVYRIAGLAPGRFRVLARAEGYFPGEGIVDVRPGLESNLTVKLRRPGALRIRVKSMEGGVSDLPVRVVDLSTGTDVSRWLEEGWCESSTGGSVTDEDGRLELRGVPEGRYRVEAGSIAKEVEVLRAPRVEDTAEVTLFLGG